MRAPSMSVPFIRRLDRWRRHEIRFRALALGIVRSGEVLESAPQACFGVDQELSGGDDVLTGAQALEDLGAAAVFSAHPHQCRSKMRAIVGHNHDAARASLDYRLRGYRQHLILRRPAQM